MTKNSNIKDEKVFNVITLGNSGVGKSSIIKRYLYNTFEDDALSTIGLSFGYKDIDIGDNKIVKLKLVDTAGQEKYRALSKSYLKNADAILYVFSFDQKESFDLINDWIDFFEKNGHNTDRVIKYLIGNKNDIEEKFEPENIEEFKSKYKIKNYISTSAKNDENINELFKELAVELDKNKKEDLPQKTLKIEKEKAPSRRRNNGCHMCQVNSDA